MEAVMTQPTNRWLQERSVSGDQYDATYDKRAAAGENVHGEADFVERFAPKTVLDAGCGTGRVARELARRGVSVMGVDIDPEMLSTARAKSPELDWVTADLAAVQLGREFEVIVMAGNVIIFVAPGSEGAVVEKLASHLAPGGRLVAGFQLRRGGIGIDHYDELATAAGLVREARYSTWDCAEWHEGDTYAVSVHRKAE